jgi:glycosyltransferase involved in cell wall biosynthesis
MPTIAVDATPLLGRPTGVGTAVAGMLGALAGRDGLELVGYALSGTGWRALPPLLPGGVRPARPLPMPAGLLSRAWSRLDHPVGEWWSGPVGVLHGTNFVVPPSRRAARLVSVYDLTALHYPHLCAPAALRYPALVARALRGGAHVHTLSRFVAEEVCEALGAHPERVHVVAGGIATPRPPTGAHREDPGPPTGRAPYILGLGTIEPRKDFPLLVAAFDRLAPSHPGLRLRIVGQPGWGAAALDAAVAASAHASRIDRPGWVADPGTELAGAAVLAYPSVYEGFGFPPLEAMALGVPVVATAAGSVPEVVGDAAVVVPVGDADALAGALCAVLDDPSRRAALVDAGRARAARYSWTATGDGLEALYRRLAPGG